MNLNSGVFKIDEDLVIAPGYTFEIFKKTRHYKNQDGIRVIYLDGMYMIDGRKFMVRLFFRDGKIYMLSLYCFDEEYSFEDEPKRKKLHDRILKEYGVRENDSFNWGKIESSYDRRGNVSSINIIYK